MSTTEIILTITAIVVAIVMVAIPVWNTVSAKIKHAKFNANFNRAMAIAPETINQ